MRRLAATLFVLLALGVVSGWADEIDEVLRLLTDKALSVHITARVTENGKETVWNMELTRVTISGRAVTIRLDGSNVIVVAQFTPYRGDDNSLLLVAQGQTWIATSEKSDVQYRTSFESLPVRLGEPVVFFPLGKKPLDMGMNSETYGPFNIELEVNVVPYSHKAE